MKRPALARAFSAAELLAPLPAVPELAWDEPLLLVDEPAEEDVPDEVPELLPRLPPDFVGSVVPVPVSGEVTGGGLFSASIGSWVTVSGFFLERASASSDASSVREPPTSKETSTPERL
jgi:hypothetical protein